MKLRIAMAAGLEGQLSRFRLPGARLARHRHPELELDHVIRGRATLMVDSRPLTLRPGSLVWLFPDQEHVITDHSTDFEMWIACFRRSLVRRTCRGSELRWLGRRRASVPMIRLLPSARARELCALFAEVSTYDDVATYNAGLAHLLLHAAGEFERAADCPSAGRSRVRPARGRRIRSGPTRHESGVAKLDPDA